MQMVDRWNTPNPWPLVALVLLLLALAWPAWLAWKRRQNATATGVPAPAPGAD